MSPKRQRQQPSFTIPLDDRDSQPMKDISSYHPHDILCGRGGGSNKNIGHYLYRNLVSFNKQLYLASKRNEKLKISQSIVTVIRNQNPPGRFLEKDAATGLWYDIGDKRAVEKTSQALREGAPKLRKNLHASAESADVSEGSGGCGGNICKACGSTVDSASTVTASQSSADNVRRLLAQPRSSFLQQRAYSFDSGRQSYELPSPSLQASSIPTLRTCASEDLDSMNIHDDNMMTGENSNTQVLQGDHPNGAALHPKGPSKKPSDPPEEHANSNEIGPSDWIGMCEILLDGSVKQDEHQNQHQQTLQQHSARGAAEGADGHSTPSLEGPNKPGVPLETKEQVRAMEVQVGELLAQVQQLNSQLASYESYEKFDKGNVDAFGLVNKKVATIVKLQAELMSTTERVHDGLVKVRRERKASREEPGESSEAQLRTTSDGKTEAGQAQRTADSESRGTSRKENATSVSHTQAPELIQATTGRNLDVLEEGPSFSWSESSKSTSEKSWSQPMEGPPQTGSIFRRRPAGTNPMEGKRFDAGRVPHASFAGSIQRASTDTSQRRLLAIGREDSNEVSSSDTDLPMDGTDDEREDMAL